MCASLPAGSILPSLCPLLHPQSVLLHILLITHQRRDRAAFMSMQDHCSLTAGCDSLSHTQSSLTRHDDRHWQESSPLHPGTSTPLCSHRASRWAPLQFAVVLLVSAADIVCAHPHPLSVTNELPGCCHSRLEMLEHLMEKPEEQSQLYRSESQQRDRKSVV